MAKQYCQVGGQALIEGVMMRGRKTTVIAVRKPDGTIALREEPAAALFSGKFFKLPFVRGVFALISSMIIGVKALMYSAEFYEDEPGYEPSKFDRWLMDRFGDKANDIIAGISMVTALVMAILFFAVLPTVLINFLRNVISRPLYLSGLEGLLKILLFVGYILMIRRMKEIKRVFMYHGAEHKSIHCLEAGGPLNVESARTFTTLHPRCGTSFLLIVMVLSILIFSFVTWSSVGNRIVMKLLLMPVVASLAFEVIRLAGKSDAPIVRFISYPGLMLQKLTTAEPDDDQLEVALAALQGVIEKEGTETVC